ncbi:hypothetical protein LN050_09020 [Comamonadaceae bacterium M7527]|nr:hypothetical protein LN050_09020 [Comamonadaceae bacterium M7527]
MAPHYQRRGYQWPYVPFLLQLRRNRPYCQFVSMAPPPPREQQLTKPTPLMQQLLLIAFAAISYATLFFLNNWVFASLEFTAGVNWLYLPAGLRLLMVLVFGLSGAIGISIASASISVFVYFSPDPSIGIVAGLISGFMPYLVQQLMQRFAHLDRNLVNINAATLMQLTLFYAVATSFGHQIWYAYRGVTEHFWLVVWPMFVGDFMGTVLVLYTARVAVKLLRRSAARRVPD